jgi:hypothetical protein
MGITYNCLKALANKKGYEIKKPVMHIDFDKHGYPTRSFIARTFNIKPHLVNFQMVAAYYHNNTITREELLNIREIMNKERKEEDRKLRAERKRQKTNNI